jgi:hypothetical protein
MPVGHMPRRSFGAGDHTTCPKCGKVMSLSRRTPHSEHGDTYERQTFTCRECGHEVERGADTHGKPHEWAALLLLRAMYDVG